MRGSLHQALLALRPQLAAAATAVLRAWEPDEDYDDLCGGGACDQIAQTMAEVIGEHLPDVQITDGGHDGDDHAWLIARLGDEVLGVDIPPHHYEEGAGYSWVKTADEVGPECVTIFPTWWPNDIELEGKPVESHPIYESIRSGRVTEDDFNQLIETTFKSVRERVRRVTEPIDHNRMNDNKGHSRTSGPSFTARAAHRPGGGAKNDPRQTGRGRQMLKRQAAKHGVSEGTAQYPEAKFEVRKSYEPICPHCNEVMGEKACVPDTESLLVRMEQPKSVSSDQLREMMHGAPDPEGVSPPLMRHRGPCYDKGAFLVNWPKTKFDEAVHFILQHQGQELTEEALDQVQDKDRLARLATRLLREDGLDRDWLWNLHRKVSR